jgi:hypothetical protein
MVKCPFCGFENEDGALFCEQCKSDLGTVEPVPPTQPIPEAMPVAEDTIPMAAVVEERGDMPEAVPVAEAAPVDEAAAAAAAAAAPPAEGAKIPAGAQPKLAVIRGQKIGVEYPVYADLNFIGRSDEKPVDIDLEDQEPPDRIWCSRQHALITLEGEVMTIEDLNSSNGTYVNRTRVYPGQKRQLGVGDVIQIGTVHLKVKV